jgi:4,5-DOPA dioxygenase extradiol
MSRHAIPAASLFVSHGSPMHALHAGRMGQMLRALGGVLPRPRAVLVVSPHWQTRGLLSLENPTPVAWHDFHGFPAELYRVRYDARSAVELHAQVLERLRPLWPAVRGDAQRDLDHGVWVPLMNLYPEADVPVLQVSMPHDLDTRSALALGQSLRTLRDEGVMILGSGSLTHNLREWMQPPEDAEMYVGEFVDFIAQAISHRDVDLLRAYRDRAPHAARAHPTEEHFLPLLVALGASRERDHAQHLKAGISERVLNMDAFLFSAEAVNLPEAGARGAPIQL